MNKIQRFVGRRLYLRRAFAVVGLPLAYLAGVLPILSLGGLLVFVEDLKVVFVEDFKHLWRRRK